MLSFFIQVPYFVSLNTFKKCCWISTNFESGIEISGVIKFYMIPKSPLDMPSLMFSLEVWQNSVMHHVQPGEMMGTYVKKTEFLIFPSLLTGCCWWRCLTGAPSCTGCGAVRKVQLLWVIKNIFFSIK